MKTIRVLLTKYGDRTSKFIYLCSGLKGFTHASLSLEDKPEEYYSFNRRGFCIETAEKCLRHGVEKSLCYEMEVTEEVFQALRRRIEIMRRNRERYSYSVLSMFMALLRIPYQRKQRYVCSTFVAEMLHRSGAMKFHRQPSIIVPNDFPALLQEKMQLKGIITNHFANPN